MAGRAMSANTGAKYRTLLVSISDLRTDLHDVPGSSETETRDKIPPPLLLDCV